MKPMGYLCHYCDICDGRGCIGELPGMGGAFANRNFILNCASWDEFPVNGETDLPRIRLAPITGAVENIGYPHEGMFYPDMIEAAVEAGIDLSIGDGVPDEKLKYGIDALRCRGTRGAVFIKPYENYRIIERMEWSSDVAEILGIDIDSYNILTMRNLARLERKTTAQLRELRRAADGKPFAIKGVFREEDIEMVEEVHPDIVVISNHGGRIETRVGSTAEALARWGGRLRKHAGEVWVDGGLRKRRDLLVAAGLGAATVMIGRPLISALTGGGKEKAIIRVRELATEKEI